MTIQSESASESFSLNELCLLAELPLRTVRYYMQIGLVDRPIGETRAAHYLGRHLEQLLRIKQLTEAGVSVERIREVLAGGDTLAPVRPRRPGSIEVRSHLYVAPGIELQISPEDAGLSPEQVRALISAVMNAFQAISETKK